MTASDSGLLLSIASVSDENEMDPGVLGNKQFPSYYAISYYVRITYVRGLSMEESAWMESSCLAPS